MKKFVLFFILFFYTVVISYSQCNNKVTAFTYGEKLTYSVYYNFSFLWLNAGEAHFDIYKKIYENRPVFYFKSFGKTINQYEWFYNVRDRYEAYSESDTLKSIFFHRKTSEGGYESNNKFFFNDEKNKIYSIIQKTNKPLTHDTLDYDACTFDVLTAVYYCRNIDYSKYQINDTIPISMIIDDEISNSHILYLGKEIIEKLNGEKYNCIKFSILLVKGSIFKGGEDMTIWVSDDRNKIPIIVEAKILVGSIKVILSDIQGEKHKITSKMD
ncbi:MAG: DUF3108 domain-containing protein [Bacteroidetes bacterium]|nr:DUF3108 domain-containing protein [Bacteroidota bacterium]